MFQRIKVGFKLTLKNIGEIAMNKQGYSDSHLKPDKTCHYKKEDMGTMAKDAKLPGQMYVPKKTSNESDFVGDKKSK